MTSVRPFFFYGLGAQLHAVTYVHANISEQDRMRILSSAYYAMEQFTSAEQHIRLLPRSVEKGKALVNMLKFWVDSHRIPTNDEVAVLHDWVNTYETIIAEEVDRSRIFAVMNQGNLSVDSLMDGASEKYPAYVLTLIDEFIKNEIDEAGICLACARYTACGFHILRAVEVTIKGYLVALKGSLPNNRNWGEYISELNKNGASSALIDELRVLKTKRNPVMHPQDILDAEQARQLFCLCEATLCAVIDDVRNRELDSDFVSSLAKLPSINKRDE